MNCTHPGEERQRVYDGTASARADRQLCGLCGEILYLAPDPASLRAPAELLARYRGDSGPVVFIPALQRPA